MNDYKELIECLKIRSEYNRDGGFWNEGVSDSIDAAIKAIEQLVRERDAAIYEMRREADNCKWCRWHDKDHPINSCVCPETCCVDGNPDRWEWRGVQE